MTVPIFTPTPVIPPSGAADMPASIGSQIGATTDANFTKTQTWGDQLDSELLVTRWTPQSAFITPATNYVINSATMYLVQGKLATLLVSINKTAGAAQVSTATGAITPATIATLITTFRPQYTIFFWGRCGTGPHFNFYINAAGQLVLRGSSAINYTYPATWEAEFEVRWVNP